MRPATQCADCGTIISDTAARCRRCWGLSRRIVRRRRRVRFHTTGKFTVALRRAAVATFVRQAINSEDNVTSILSRVASLFECSVRSLQLWARTPHLIDPHWEADGRKARRPVPYIRCRHCHSRRQPGTARGTLHLCKHHAYQQWKLLYNEKRLARARIAARLRGVVPRTLLRGHMHPNWRGGRFVWCSRCDHQEWCGPLHIPPDESCYVCSSCRKLDRITHLKHKLERTHYGHAV